MADGLNRVILLGNLGADPELRFTGSGTAVLNIRLATSETYLDRDRNRKQRTDWHNVTVWGARAEGLSKILSKGSRILVEGSLRTSSYETRDGEKRYKTEVNASNIVLNDPPRGNGESRERHPDRDTRPARDHSSTRPIEQSDFDDDDDDDDDDIPF